MKNTLSAEYVLGSLQGLPRKGFARRLRKDPRLQQEVKFWEEHFSSLAQKVPALVPDESVFIALEKRLAQTPMSINTISPWSRVSVWRGLALVASLAFVLLLNQTKPWKPAPIIEKDTVSVSVIQNSQSKALWMIQVSSASRQLTMKPLGPVDIKADQSFELWMLPGKEAPVSLGVLPLEGISTLFLNDKQWAALQQTQTLAVSLEPKNGSPTGGPTGPVLYTAAILKTS